jgi:hypothetical protein
MPVKPEHRRHYRTDAWRELSRYVRFVRAGGHCECTGQCGTTHAGGRCGAHDLDAYPGAHAQLGLFAGFAREAARVSLGAAHKVHRPAAPTDDESDVDALCARCHLGFDRTEHLRARAQTQRRRRLQPELFK